MQMLQGLFYNADSVNFETRVLINMNSKMLPEGNTTGH
jgi:hypothetical protein